MSTYNLEDDIELLRAALKPRGDEETWDEVDLRLASERVFEAARSGAEAPAPVLAALLAACDEVQISRTGIDGSTLCISAKHTLDLARAIDHWRAAKAEGFDAPKPLAREVSMSDTYARKARWP